MRPALKSEQEPRRHHDCRPNPYLTIGQEPRWKDTMVGMDRLRVGLGAKKEKFTGADDTPTHHHVSTSKPSSTRSRRAQNCVLEIFVISSTLPL